MARKARRSTGRPYGAGKVASYSGANECPRCGRDIVSANDMAKAKGRWIHKWCASGADDE